MISTTISENKLSDKWQAKRKYSNFVYDGILCKEKWEDESPKIMFLLKESADHFTRISESEIDVRKGNGNHFWWNICYWKYVVKSLSQNIVPYFINADELPESKNQYKLDSISYVNIKKQCDNKTKSDDREILRYAINDKDFLKEQIDLINPSVVFCSNITFKCYETIYNKLNTSINDLYFLHNGRLIIKFYHPSYFQIKGGRERLFEILKGKTTDEKVLNILRKFI